MKSTDLLYGVAAISTYLTLTNRQVYHLHDQVLLPTFKIGGKVCARQSTLADHFARMEATPISGDEDLSRNRRPGRIRGRPASVIVGAAKIASHLRIDPDELARLDAARALPTYVADGQLCALASELTRWEAGRAEA